MKIIKKGCVVPFRCGMCECEFIAGIHSVAVEDGNFYSACPMCGVQCHTDYSRIDKETGYEISKFLAEKQKVKNGNTDFESEE